MQSRNTFHTHTHTQTHTRLAEVAQSVEHQLPKLRVAGSNPVFRSDRQLIAEFAVNCFCLLFLYKYDFEVHRNITEYNANGKEYTLTSLL